jgi:hypothetical protein
VVAVMVAGGGGREIFCFMMNELRPNLKAGM